MLEEIVFFSIIINKSLCAGDAPGATLGGKTSLGLPVFPFFAIYLYKGVWL